jgi:hypothetical protein
MIQRKQEENEQLTHELKAADDTTKMFIVKERVTARTIVTIGEYQTSLEPTESGVCVRADGNGILVEALPESMESIESMLTAIEAAHDVSEQDESYANDTESPDSDHAESDLLEAIIKQEC